MPTATSLAPWLTVRNDGDAIDFYERALDATVLNLKAVGVRELRELITESWRLQAPPKLRAAYDSDHPRC